MRRRSVVFAVGLSLVAGIASAVAFALSQTEERAPESLLPADSVIYFGWDGTEKHKAAWEKTACYEALDKSHLVKTIVDFAVSYIPADSPVSEKAVQNLLESIARRGISASVAFPKEQSLPRVVVVLHRSADLEPLFNGGIPKLAADVGRFNTVTIRGRHVTRTILERLRDTSAPATKSADPELAWWAEGGHLVVVFGPGATEAALDVADGKSPAVTQNPNWHRLREEPKESQTIVAAWCDVAALRTRFGTFALQEKTANAPKFTVGQLIDLLGAGRVGTVALRCGLEGRALVSNFSIDAPAPRTGLFALADQKTITLAELPPLPRDNTGFVLTSFDWSKAYETILGVVRDIADASTDHGRAKVDGAMQQAPAFLGFDPKTELVDTLGHVVCVYGDAAAGIPGGLGFSIALAVEKPDVLKKTLKTGFEKLQTLFPNGFSAAEEERSGRPTWIFDLGSLPVHPAVALDKHWLFVGLAPQSIESALMRLDGKLDRWKPSEADQAALDSVPKEFVAISLTDPRPLYTTVVTYLPLVGGFINQAAEQAAKTSGDPNAKRAAEGRMALLAVLPPAEVITRSMFPNVSAVTVDARGVHLQSRESAPGLSTGVFVVTPVAVALLLPAVQAAREAARRTQSRNNLKQLGIALHNYHDVYHSFPPGTHPNAALKPEKRLSWEAEILPYIEKEALYKQIDFSKSWDNPANQKAVASVVEVFLNPSLAAQPNGIAATNYVGMAGLGADGPNLPVTSPRAGVFAYDRVTRIRDITDGTSMTIMASECNKDLGSWAAGGRPTIRSLTAKPYFNGPDGLGGDHPGACMVLLADGSVRALSTNTDPKVLEALMTICGGETVGSQ